MPKRKQYIDRTLRKDRLGDTLVHILLGNFQELPIQHEIFKKKGEKNYTYRALKKKWKKKWKKKMDFLKTRNTHNIQQQL